ncbi:protein of unknown function [endosymbiont DhMRE of Dentiscutata heterogama]|uniref:hypothetical protein n=1 Tax=endosymbiont DhMRE of Dentiscutata heterogama TaxID=1609546 RepID=UPI000629D65F|nr:hypothetical protein [endosymbiont DhMRE of Dentiscutata heterogama]CFW92968.1 protein of unknown function [endosymbiont DhMRE of Dentiscutata heterogama]
MLNEQKATVQERKQVLINRIANLEATITGNLQVIKAYLENNERIKAIIAELQEELKQIEQELVAQVETPTK